MINDPLYNHPVFGPNKGKGGDIGKTDDDLVKELIEIHNSENWLGENEPGQSSPDQNLITPCPEDSQPDKTGQFCESPDSGVSLDTPPPKQTPDTPVCPPDTKGKTDPHCYECTVKYRDPRPKDLVMFLHALKYQVSLWVARNFCLFAV